MKIKQVCLKADGLKLAGEVYIPPLENRPYPALCICHGIPATIYNPAEKGYAVLARRFCAAGFITLIFNFRGAGRSQGNMDMLGWSRDLQAALDFLYGVKEIDKTRLYLLGFSGGAAVSVYTAVREPRVSSLIACACPADFGFFITGETAPSFIEHLREIGVIRDRDFPPSIEEWLQGFEAVAPIQWIDKISPRPLLLVHGDSDELVPVENAHKLYRKAREPKELAIIPDAKHKLRLEEVAIATVLDWLKARC